MAVRMSQYSRQMDKPSAGKSVMAQHKRAVHKSSTTTKEDKYDKPSLIDRVILGMLRMGKGKDDKRIPTPTLKKYVPEKTYTKKEKIRLQRSKKGK